MTASQSASSDSASARGTLAEEPEPTAPVTSPFSAESSSSAADTSEASAQSDGSASTPVAVALRAIQAERAAAGENGGEPSPDNGTRSVPEAPEAEHSTLPATVATAESHSDGTSATTATATKPGRPRKSALAGAAIAGALLVAVPFLVSGGEGGHRSTGAAPLSGTVIGDSETGAPGSFGSAAPRPGASAAVPSLLAADGKHGQQPQGGEKAEERTDAPTAPAKGGKPAGTSSPSTPKTGSGAGTANSVGSAAGSSAAVSGSGKTVTSDSQSHTVTGLTIKSHDSGRCINGSAGKDGTPLKIWDCNGSAAEGWQFMSDGTVRAFGKCMDLAWASTSNGTSVQLANCNGGWAQQFRLNSAHDLVNPHADKCVDVKDQNTGNGTRLQLWSCNGHDNQKWSKS
ncbi:ricin-type beta-trefoil lectin domain protein [Streptomyces sp. NPDC051362]|uniref:ricin-type beta-trefoil lectin domain protein n=1 Tax=Streptomyces sp. NPDC051362 TaxID=3365651 RepID=UPI00379543F1